MTNITEKQHYVPQFYLKNFATSESRGSKTKKIMCYIKSKNTVLRNQSVKEVGHENYFYQLDTDPEQKIENAFGDVETLVGPVLKNLISERDLNKLTSKENEALSAFVALQYTRTKRLRSQLPSFLQFAASEMVREGVISKDFLQSQDVSGAEVIKKRHLTLITSTLKPILSAISQMKWMLVENRSSTPFVTSDNPVVLVDKSQNIDTNLSGLVGWLDSNENANPNLTVICPLSPKLPLMLYTNYPLGRQIIEKDEDSRFFNTLQITQSHDLLFANQDIFGSFEAEIKGANALDNIARKGERNKLRVAKP